MIQRICLFSGIGLILTAYGIGRYKRYQLKKSWADFKDSIEE